VIVDSGSTPPLVQRDWQLPPGTRIVRVDEPGVGRARVAGARAASGEWIVFVDDDNVLDADYLTEAEGVIARHPDIALFCGRISAEFEEPPPPWVLRFKRQLAIIDFDEDSWARYWDPAKIPCWTAGMCIRSDIMNMYCDEIQKDAFATALTRVEDVYLVMRTVAKGHLAGLFRGLHLRHLIPKNRMTQEYLCGIVYETGYNVTVLRWRRHQRPSQAIKANVYDDAEAWVVAHRPRRVFRCPGRFVWRLGVPRTAVQKGCHRCCVGLGLSSAAAA
jgi:hypothetical protein